MGSISLFKGRGASCVPGDWQTVRGYLRRHHLYDASPADWIRPKPDKVAGW